MQAMSKSSDKDRDRISVLPVEVLLHILSFVPTRQAIQMSLLSKRWRYLWTSIPSLHFSQGEFPWVKGGINSKFLDFVDQVLTLRSKDENIKKFYFSSIGKYEGHVRERILHAIRGRNVEELVLHVGTSGERVNPAMPRCIFMCQLLRVLKLDMVNWVLKLPNALSLSRLKVLHLKSIVFEGDSLDKLIARCPSLEELHLGECYLETLTISDKKLKKLHISNCGAKSESKVQVSVPSLLSIEYNTWGQQHWGPQHCSLDNLVSLVEVVISMHYDDMATISGIFRGICNASYLKLNFDCYQDLCLEEKLVGCLPIFHNLTCLMLDVWLNKDCVQAIIYILQHSPNLKTLSVGKYGPFKGSILIKQEDLSWTPKVISPSFLLHLREVKLYNFESSALDQGFAEFLL